MLLVAFVSPPWMGLAFFAAMIICGMPGLIRDIKQIRENNRQIERSRMRIHEILALEKLRKSRQ